MDVHEGPDFHGKIPGIFLHAAATHSLIGSSVYIPTDFAMNWFEIILGWILIVVENMIVVVLCKRVPHDRVSSVTERSLRYWRSALFVMFVMLAISATLFYKIVWTEVMFLFVGLVVADPLESGYEWLKNKYERRKVKL
jgi:hypothetical protein